jgi:hypothetical protein
MINYSFAIWIGLSVALLVLFLYAAVMNLRQRQEPEVSLEEMIPLMKPVNLDLLLQIASDTQDQLESGLVDLRAQQRRQIQAASEYLRRMNHNAAVLQRIGYAQLRSPNPMLAEQAQHLIDAGVHVRLYTFAGLAVLLFWRFFGLNLLGASMKKMRQFVVCMLLPSYESLKETAGTLTALRNTSLRHDLRASL